MAIFDIENFEGPDIEGNVATDEIVALAEPKKADALEKENLEYQGLVAFIEKKFQRSRDKRLFDEQRWIKCYNNFRGVYGPDTQFTSSEKSRAFIKITKTKVFAAYAQILDILFPAGSKFPVGVEPSKNPEGIAKDVSFDPKKPEGISKEEEKPNPTVARKSILENLGLLKNKLEPMKDKLVEGTTGSPSEVVFEPAKLAAKNMNDLMQDQLEEAGAAKDLRSAAFELCLFGTGILMGPFPKHKEYARWQEDGTYDPIVKDIPDIQWVSIWDFYPDPDANNMKDSELAIRRHKLSRSALRDLKNRPHFRSESIEAVIAKGPNYIREWWELDITDSEVNPDVERWEVLEYWGVMDKDLAKEAGIKLPRSLKNRDQVQVNAWICGSHILRLVLNPFTPARIPFQVAPYELNPYSFFGVGVAENMEDSQLLMNGFMRLAVDNGVLSGNVILEVDETNLVDGQDFEITPGKIIRRNGGPPGQSVNAINIPNNTQAYFMMFDKARQIADEATGMPSYSHGQAGVTSVGRTASGMSMLMGAAKENIKAVVRNIDDYILLPLAKSLFAFNMQFNFDKKFIGDVQIVARGTESLMRNEVRSQKILQFLQLTANPMDAPYVKREYLLRELSQSLDLEADKTVNDSREAALQAALMKDMMLAQGIDPSQGQQNGTSNPAGPQGNPTGMPSPADPTQNGGGNVSPGAAPEPGAQGNTQPGMMPTGGL